MQNWSSLLGLAAILNVFKHSKAFGINISR